MNSTNKTYSSLLVEILANGDKVTTRNSDVHSHFNLPNVTFNIPPLVTVRKTAWKKALREMEWFLSGDSKCPDELLDWWNGQLDWKKRLIDGYGQQLTSSNYFSHVSLKCCQFNQVKFIQDALKSNPNSRRLLMTTWNAGEMAHITETNDNPNTPTCCHSIIVQFFARNGELSMKTYQRSADMLLGVPHNWIQSWAMLMWFAHHAGLKVGTMTWMWGDAHIYDDESHLKTARNIIDATYHQDVSVEMVYTPTTTEFKASDFEIVGVIPQPIVTIKPRLL